MFGRPRRNRPLPVRRQQTAPLRMRNCSCGSWRDSGVFLLGAEKAWPGCVCGGMKAGACLKRKMSPWTPRAARSWWLCEFRWRCPLMAERHSWRGLLIWNPRNLSGWSWDLANPLSQLRKRPRRLWSAPRKALKEKKGEKIWGAATGGKCCWNMIAALTETCQGHPPIHFVSKDCGGRQAPPSWRKHLPLGVKEGMHLQWRLLEHMHVSPQNQSSNRNSNTFFFKTWHIIKAINIHRINWLVSRTGWLSRSSSISLCRCNCQVPSCRLKSSKPDSKSKIYLSFSAEAPWLWGVDYLQDMES